MSATDWADHWFSRFRWYRRWRGGTWQRWFIDSPVGSWMWFRNQRGRPGLGRGLPDVEVYE